MSITWRLLACGPALLGGCGHPPESQPEALGLAITATVASDFHFAQISQASYRVDVLAENTGTEPLAFDLVEIVFTPRRGAGLRQETTFTTEGGIFALAPGGRWDAWYSTDGYTIDLLRDASGGPLYFHMTFFLHGVSVAGPFSAPLPNLGSLPDYYATLVRPQQGEGAGPVYLALVTLQGRPVPQVKEAAGK